MCERLDKIDEMTRDVKERSEKLVDTAHRLCMTIVKSNGQIKSALRENACEPVHRAKN